MLKNNRCILAYNLSKEEIDKIKKAGISVIKIEDTMVQMKIKDIIQGYKFEAYKEVPKEKVILFNNFGDEEISPAVKYCRAVVKEVILAVVTPTSIEWSFAYLINHLIEEREWHRATMRKG